MGAEPKKNIAPFIIGGVLYLFSLLVTLFLPRSLDLSLTEQYLMGMLETLGGIAGLIGVFILLITIGKIYWRKKDKAKCSQCGAVIPHSSDKFCISCGAKL